jgi:hypothetical protein
MRTGDGAAGSGKGDGGAAGAGVSSEGGEAAGAAVAVEREWGKKKKIQTSGPHKKVYKITQMRYVQALSCHVSTDSGSAYQKSC